MTERASCVAVWLRTIVGLSSPMPYSVPNSTGWSKPDATSSADGGVETIWVGEERERLAGAATGCIAHDATAAELEAALLALPNVLGVRVEAFDAVLPLEFDGESDDNYARVWAEDAASAQHGRQGRCPQHRKELQAPAQPPG